MYWLVDLDRKCIVQDYNSLVSAKYHVNTYNHEQTLGIVIGMVFCTLFKCQANSRHLWKYFIEWMFQEEKRIELEDPLDTYGNSS